MLTNIETFNENDKVYLLAPHVSALQSNAQKFRKDYVGTLAIDMKIDDTHYFLKDITSHTLKGDYHINRLKKSRSEEFHFGGSSRLLHINHAWEPHVNEDCYT